MFLRTLNKTKAQATTELALFGTIILAIFAALLRYGSIYTTKQKTQMYAFRKSLELAKRRHDGRPINGEHADTILELIGGYAYHLFGITLPFAEREFAAVSLNVQKNTYSVDVQNPNSPQETATVDGAASVNIETEAANFADWTGDWPISMSDSERTYYQFGDDWINRDQYTEPPYIWVARAANDNVPTHPWDGFFELLNGQNKDEKKIYVALQPVSYKDTEQNTTIDSTNQYSAKEGVDAIAYNQDNRVHKTTTTTMHPPGLGLFGGNNIIDITAAMWLWDHDVRVAIVPFGVSDMTVTTTQDVTKTRTWNTPRQ